MKKGMKCFFIDLDGTILGKDNTIAFDTLKAVNMIKETGNFLFINTGRSYAALPDVFYSSLQVDGVICGLGSYILIGKDKVQDQYIDPLLLSKLICWALEENIQIKISGEKLILVNRKPYKYKEKEIRNNEDIYLDHYVEVCMCGNMSLKLEKFLDENFGVNRYLEFYEVTRMDVSKGKALEFVMNMYFPGYTSIAIGDSMNDFSMIECADIGFYIRQNNEVGNRILSADYICTKCEEAIRIALDIPE